MPAGRPTKYTSDYATKLDGYGGGGESVAETCVYLGISKQAFYDWQKAHPEFYAAVEGVRLRSQVWWEKGGRSGTFGKIPGFNSASYQFNMKNRFADDWRDKVETDLTSSDGTMSLNQNLTDEELDREIERRGLSEKLITQRS